MLFLAKLMLYIYSVAYTWSEDPELHVKGTRGTLIVFQVDGKISPANQSPWRVIDSQAVQLFSEVSGLESETFSRFYFIRVNREYIGKSEIMFGEVEFKGFPLSFNNVS